MSETEYQENYHFIVSHPEVVAREMTRLTARTKELEGAMHRFCDRVEAGEIKSKATYAEFCVMLSRAAIKEKTDDRD